MNDSPHITREEALEQINDSARGQRYTIEKRLTEGIRLGDIDAVNETMKEWLLADDPYEDLPFTGADNLALYKNQLENTNTYSRIAAMNGGVLPQLLYFMSNENTIIITNSESIEYLTENVHRKMCADYCLAVKDFSTIGYSEKMKLIVAYVMDHLTEDLTLNVIAEKFDMHPVHLARKFKQETSMTFIEYINNMRIKMSKYLFHLNLYSLSEVAYLSGFNSHSYFTKVFRKVTGTTPSKYMKKVTTFDD